MRAVVDEKRLTDRRLPLPDANALAHSLQVAQAIADTIKSKGPISFADYMDMALYAPGLGYYCVGTEKFGSSGDFITAPELSPLFAESIADFCVKQFTQLNNQTILEVGSGSGRLAVNLLRALRDRASLPERYYILETSPDLQARQRELLAAEEPELLKCCEWLKRLPESPIKGVIIANEVLDAMPVHLFTATAAGFLERVVNVADENFIWQTQSVPDSLQAALANLNIDFADGYQSEINLHIAPWIKSMASILNSGAILLIDYGFMREEYYHPDRSMGTLMCHYRHHAHADPLILPGIQDITAHVDFTAVAQAAEQAQLQVNYYGTQAQFLLQHKLLDNLQRLAKDQTDYLRLANQVKILTMPSEMGELFKVMVLTV